MGRSISSRRVRVGPVSEPLCTEKRTTRKVVEGRAVDQVAAPLVAVEWEDITAYSRTALPEDFESYRLRKLTCLRKLKRWRIDTWRLVRRFKLK